MVAENIFVQISGTIFDGVVLAGSQTASFVIICGVSGTGVYPLMVNNSGLGIFAQGSPSA